MTGSLNMQSNREIRYEKRCNMKKILEQTKDRSERFQRRHQQKDEIKSEVKNELSNLKQKANNFKTQTTSCLSNNRYFTRSKTGLYSKM